MNFMAKSLEIRYPTENEPRYQWFAYHWSETNFGYAESEAEAWSDARKVLCQMQNEGRGIPYTVEATNNAIT